MYATNSTDVPEDAQPPRRSNRLLSRDWKKRLNVLRAADDQQQSALQALTMDAVSISEVDCQNLWQDAMRVNRSISGLCGLFEEHLREERETLNMVHQCLDKYRKMSNIDACSEPTESAVLTRAYTFTDLLLDICMCVMLIFLALIAHKWMFAAEAQARHFFNIIWK